MGSELVEMIYAVSCSCTVKKQQKPNPQERHLDTGKGYRRPELGAFRLRWSPCQRISLIGRVGFSMEPPSPRIGAQHPVVPYVIGPFFPMF